MVGIERVALDDVAGADEAAHELELGAGIDVLGCSKLVDPPPFITAIMSAVVMASDWSG